MKPLALLVFLAALALPASSQTTAPSDDSAEIEREKMNRQLAEIRKMREDFKSESLKRKEPPPARRLDASPSAVVSPGEGLPLLFKRLAKGTGGYSNKDLSNNLDWTRKNIHELIDFISPWKKDVKSPAAEQAAAAQKLLAAESAVAAELIKEADAALAKGIPRDPPAGGSLSPMAPSGYFSRATRAYANPTAEQRLETKAGIQANVAGHLSSLLELKRFNPPAAEDEAKTEQWLEAARKDLAKHQ